MQKNNLINILALGILTVGLGIGLILVKQKQEIREKASATSDIGVSLSPLSATLFNGQKTTIAIKLANQTVPGRALSVYTGGVDIGFDSTFFSVSNLSCNSSFLSSTATSAVSGNSLSISCFAPGGSGSKVIVATAQTTLATFDITALAKTGSSPIAITRANVPDAVTYVDLSGGGGVGGTYNTVNCPSRDKGNLNCDANGLINETDLSILLANWCTGNCNLPTPAPGTSSPDLNGDGKVNETDLSILLANWKPI